MSEADETLVINQVTAIRQIRHAGGIEAGKLALGVARRTAELLEERQPQPRIREPEDAPDDPADQAAVAEAVKRALRMTRGW